MTVLPALSVQLPVTVAVGEAGPEYVAEVQDAMPENELPWKEIVSGWLYPSHWSRARGDAVAVAIGEVVSTSIKYVTRGGIGHA